MVGLEKDRAYSRILTEAVRNRRLEPRGRRIELGRALVEGWMDSGGGGARLMTNIASIMFHAIMKNVTFSKVYGLQLWVGLRRNNLSVCKRTQPTEDFKDRLIRYDGSNNQHN